MTTRTHTPAVRGLAGLAVAAGATFGLLGPLAGTAVAAPNEGTHVSATDTASCEVPANADPEVLTIIERELYGPNPSIYPSRSPFAVQTPGFSGLPRVEEARALLREAGYDGEPVVLLDPSNLALLNKLPTVMAALLRRAGFAVRLETMDWATLVARRAVRKPPSQGGWNAFVTGWLMADNANPMFFPPLSGLGERGWYGWNADEGLERLKQQFVEEADAARRHELALRIQERAFEDGVLAPLGEFKLLSAYRRGAISGLITAPVNVLWGASKH